MRAAGEGQHWAFERMGVKGLWVVSGLGVCYTALIMLL